MADNKFTIQGTLNLKYDISADTVGLALKIIECWLNDNPDKRITGGTRLVNGKVAELRIEQREKCGS